jgi:hypothetical protein
MAVLELLFNFVKKNLPFTKPVCLYTGGRKKYPGGLTVILDEATRMAGARREDSAYRSGWEDGRFGTSTTFVTNANLGSWTEYMDRLAYYRGHRDGRRVREMLGVGSEAV